MLFAWADDPTILDEIITLDSMEKIPRFFETYNGEVIFIFDQMNAFTELDEDGEQARDRKGKMSAWLLSCRAGCKAIFSSSANYRAFLHQLQKENSLEPLIVQGGFTKVSLGEHNRSAEGVSNCDLDGNGAVVEAE